MRDLLISFSAGFAAGSIFAAAYCRHRHRKNPSSTTTNLVVVEDDVPEWTAKTLKPLRREETRFESISHANLFLDDEIQSPLTRQMIELRDTLRTHLSAQTIGDRSDEILICIDELATIDNVLSVLNRRNIRSILVCDRFKRVIGVADVWSAVFKRLTASSDRAYEVVHDFVSITESDSIWEAAKKMFAKKTHHLLVTRADTIVGVISRRDVVCRITKVVENLDIAQRKMIEFFYDPVPPTLLSKFAPYDTDTIVRTMVRQRSKALAVVDDDARIVDVISMSDMRMTTIVRDDAFQVRTCTKTTPLGEVLDGLRHFHQIFGITDSGALNGIISIDRLLAYLFR